MIPHRAGGASRAREAARRWLPLGLRAWVMGTSRRPVPEPAPPPGAGALGAIDVPARSARVTGEVVHVVGWALCDGRMASSVEVRIDGVLLGRARLGLVRPDLEHLGDDAVAAGFEFHASLAASDRRSHTIAAVAHFAAGKRLAITGPTIQVIPRPRRLAPARGARGDTPLRLAATDGRLRILAVTHQLDLGGGQLYLQDLLRGLVRTGRFHVTVASCLPGPLRSELEELGIGVHLTGPWPHDGITRLEDRLDEFAAWMREGGYDAVLVNTAISFPAVAVAARLGIPCVWAIHESYPLPLLVHALLGNEADPDVAALVVESLRQADRLIFEAEATRALYVDAAGEERCMFVPYGIELAALDTAAAAVDRGVVRRRLGFAPDARVLLCMGTFEVRKAQTVILRAFADVADRHPQASLVLFGDNRSDYAFHVRRLAEATGLGPRIRIVEVGPDIVPWYIAADVLVSASDVESTPRSAVEAMFLETPVLAADVYGLSELVEDGVTGWLVPARDVEALAAGMDRALASTPAALRSMAARAREHARRHHDAAGYVGTVASLLDDLVASTRRAVEPSRGG